MLYLKVGRTVSAWNYPSVICLSIAMSGVLSYSALMGGYIAVHFGTARANSNEQSSFIKRFDVIHLRKPSGVNAKLRWIG